MILGHKFGGARSALNSIWRKGRLRSAAREKCVRDWRIKTVVLVKYTVRLKPEAQKWFQLKWGWEALDFAWSVSYGTVLDRGALRKGFGTGPPCRAKLPSKVPPPPLAIRP